MCVEPNNQAINKSVADYYKNVATDAQEIRISPIKLGKLLGYSEEELASAPAETNAGLGCGNPHRKAKIQEGEVVVDLGCGKGMDVFIAASKVGDTGQVIGIDMVSEMVDQARLTSEKHHFSNVEFQVGKIEQLPLKNAMADLVISNGVISLTTNKPQVFREIHRILKPGGRISIADITLEKPLPGSVLADTNQYDI